jgi:predicted nucleic acid-binding protein
LSTRIVFSHDCIILDACCAINLHMSGRMEEILKALPGGVALAIFVLDEEILRSNLQPLIEQGLIRAVSLDSEAEEHSFVNFAAELDDGEAVTGAIAMHRHWGIATDDRKARRVFARTNPYVQLLSTPELIKYWADTHKPPIEVVREVLQNIQTQARYKPSAAHALHSWWQSIVCIP